MRMGAVQQPQPAHLGAVAIRGTAVLVQTSAALEIVPQLVMRLQNAGRTLLLTVHFAL
jgi:hypothetical protein